MTNVSDLVRATGGRRFTLALLVLATAVGGRAMQWIDGAQFMSLLRDLLGIYGIANVGGRVVGALTSTKTPTP